MPDGQPRDGEAPANGPRMAPAEVRPAPTPAPAPQGDVRADTPSRPGGPVPLGPRTPGNRQSPGPANRPTTAPRPAAGPDEEPLILGTPPARARGRHWLAAASFLLIVVVPTLMAATYLAFTAADRYGSRVAFSIRSNEAAAPVEILGAVTQLGGSSVLTDGQVLHDFIQSQQIVESVRARLPLEDYWNRAPGDWVFSLGRGQPIEEIVEHWNSAVDVSLDPGTGIVTVEARAFRPEEAQAIAAAILEASAELVNHLADIAREDAVRYARIELEEAEARLREIRTRLRQFRNVEQDVDPSQNARVAIELVAQLEEELSRSRVQLELLRGALDESAPRIGLLKRQIESLESRIAAERTRLGTGAAASDDARRPLSAVVGEFEELVVDREFAEQAYTLALATYQQAEAEARRRHRYLAPHIEPTLAEAAEYPDRPLLTAVVFLLALGIWSVLVLGAYGIRDRG
jgi:capsular polysaccharide transport system permease protein